MSRIKDLVKACRPTQWTKNLLILIPLFLAGNYSLQMAGQSVLTFVVFSILASSTYLVNDLIDFESDKTHPIKSLRPIASGKISKPLACLTAFALAATSFTISLMFLPLSVTAWLLGYAVLSLIYTLRIKAVAIWDVILLALLYTLRLTTGTSAVEAYHSYWLISFSFLFFLGLALLKRASEIKRVTDGINKSGIKGRGYQTVDYPMIHAFGVGVSLAVIVVYLLFVADVAENERYDNPMLLWFVSPIIVFLQTHLWLREGRGLVNEDPLKYLLKDKYALTWIIIAGLIFAIGKNGIPVLG